ncbi:transglycosylase domain-containing protein [Intestinimonas butyriciproducens]|uniref:transglycosylase domain-containing protein n=3 Tax=Intestinimonas butyriciproducens TaxID=1297617 RepID=UPI00189EDC95|nr:transglycosylase domain-containing protein [Intestinimonas butyriciproducens]
MAETTNHNSSAGGETPRRRRQRRVSGAGVALGVGKVLGTLLLIAITTGAILACFAAVYIKTVILPQTYVDARAFTMNLSSTIYYTDPDTGEEKELRTLHGEENRVLVDYDEIPEHLIAAVVSIEDERFWTHHGVDWKRTAGAFVNMFLGMKDTYGGSTLTQQLIKNMTDNDEVTVKRKILEIFRALEFERNYSKEEILEMYLNYIYLGESCYGVGTASYTYFGKPVSELSLAESASLISITNNPSAYDPYISERSKERNKERQELVLYKMCELGYITEEEKAAAAAEELVFVRGDGEKSTTAYTYYEDQLIRDVIADLQASQDWSEQVATQMVYSGGLKIYSCFNPKVQACVDEVYQNLENFNHDSSTGQQLQSAITVIDNETGNVVAVAGGVGEKSGSLLLNRALSQRQPGSAIKPLAVYAPALEYGLITPATVIDDSPYNNNGTNGAAWPVNSFGAYRGLTNVYTGLQNSVNTLAVKIMGDYITPQLSFDFLTQNLGFSTDHLVIRRESNGTVYSDIDIAPLALGGLTDGITTLEMAAAYASFPRGGVYIAPRTYTKVVADDGVTVLLDNEQESSIAMKDSTAWYINYMLRNAMINGTGTYARFDGMTMAGKTGTTSSRKDLYFAGYTPYYTAAVWSGYDQPERMSSSLQQQSAVIWNKVMSAIHQGLENASFPEPAAGLVQKTVCLDSGLLPTDACRHDARVGEDARLTTLTFVRGDEPTEFCDVHVDRTVCLDSPLLNASGEPTGMYHLAGEFCPEESKRVVSILDIAREGAAASVTVKDNKFTTGHLDALGAAAYCDVHTTAQSTEEPKETTPVEIDPYDPTTWPGVEDFDSVEDYNNFNPFDPSTWPNHGAQVTPTPTPSGGAGETPEVTPAPPAASPTVTPGEGTDEPFIPAGG